MSDFESAMAEARGALPNPKGSAGQGPLARQLDPAERERRQRQAEAAEAERIAKAEEMLDVLLAAGKDPNEARMLLGLDPVFTGPEDDPRPWVDYYVPKVVEEGLPPGAAMCPVCFVLVGDVGKHLAAVHPDHEPAGEPDWVREQDVVPDDWADDEVAW